MADFDNPTARRIASQKGMRVLLLSGGGANGAAEASAVLELYCSGYRPDLLVGTSIGAWNAAYLSTHPGVEGARQLVELWKSGAFLPMSKPSPFQLARYALRKTPSLIGEKSTREAARAIGIDTATSSDCEVPFIIGAVDIATGGLRYWHSKDLPGDAVILPYVAASSALAPLQPLASVGGVQYADAGFQDNYGIPETVRTLRDMGMRASLTVIDAAPSTLGHPVVTPSQGLVMASGLLFRGRLAADIDAARKAGHEISVIGVGGNHAVTDYLDPEMGVTVGENAVRAWGRGESFEPVWASQGIRALAANVKRLLFRAPVPRFERTLA